MWAWANKPTPTPTTNPGPTTSLQGDFYGFRAPTAGLMSAWHTQIQQQPKATSENLEHFPKTHHDPTTPISIQYHQNTITKPKATPGGKKCQNSKTLYI